MAAQGKFTTGPTMRHVVVMALSGSFGLVFVFLVDFAALFWVSQLGVEQLIAAVGFGWIVQFAVVSVSIGMMIGVMAMIAPELGRGNIAVARWIAAQSIVFAMLVMAVVTALVLLNLEPILAGTGATGETREIYLHISLPSMPVMILGMITSSILRAAGEALRAMFVTLSGGMVALLVDPVLIWWMGLGAEGAALSIVISRLVMAGTGMWYLVRVKQLIGRPGLPDWRGFVRPFLAVALPAIATQMATPFGNWVLTRAMAEFGDSAVAGWGVVSRLTILVFGGIFALAGSIGGIFGQNYGVGRLDRVRATYWDALKFCAVYTMVAWAMLFASQGLVVRAFGLSSEGAEVVRAFTSHAAGAFVFAGALFVANSAFNNLGRPLWSTGFNWLRDGLLMYPTAVLFGAWLGAPGVIYAQAAAGVLAGGLAAAGGWAYVRGLQAPPTRA